MRRPAVVAAALLLTAAAGAETGRTAGGTLNRTYSAAPAALGGAYGAVAGSLDAVFFNPASAAAMPAPEIQATYLSGLDNDSLGGLRYGHSLGFGGLYAGVDYYDAGAIDVNLSDGTQESRRAQQDTVGTLGIAFGRRSPLSIGAAVKAFRLELAEEASASGVAFDAGILWATPLRGLAIGLSGTNAGADVEFEEESDPLPVTGRAALSYTLELSRFRRLQNAPYEIEFLVDGVAERDEDAAVRTGIELRRTMASVMEKIGSVALRGGYQADPQVITVGLGVRLAGLGLDYAFSSVQDVDNAHRATLSWRFLSRADKVEAGVAPKPVRRRPSVPR
jgi:hypothetical protein